MAFWVLENTVHNYNRIHLDECPHCNYGKGPIPGHTGCWYGEFISYGKALSWAEKNGRPIENCKHCKPESASPD